MPKTVGDAFQELIERVQPSEGEADARLRHRKRVEQALASVFGEPQVKPFGSHMRGTAIHEFSDVDLLAQIPRAEFMHGDKLVTSTTMLKRVRDALSTALKQTDVRVDACGVLVNFAGGAEAVDVIPAAYWGTVAEGDGYPKFLIPDGEGWWRETSPGRHTKYLKEENERARHKLFRVAQLLKYAKHTRASPMPFLGFHVEMVLAAEELCVGAKSYQNCVYDGFRRLAERAGAALRDPVGISGNVSAAQTEVKKAQLSVAASYCADHARRAIAAELEGDRDEAFRQWDLVFNQHFPSKR